jgi:hypothetical protein
MSTIINTHKFTAAAAFGAAALFSMLSFGSSAEASSVLSCEGTTIKSVVSCCHEMTRDQRPYWMIRSGKNCDQVVACRAKKAHATTAVAFVAPVKRCYVKLADENPNDGGEPGDGGGTRRGGGRGPNNPSSSPQ